MYLMEPRGEMLKKYYNNEVLRRDTKSSLYRLTIEVHQYEMLVGSRFTGVCNSLFTLDHPANQLLA